MTRVHFDTVLSLIAAIASSVAAIGAFFTGFYSMQAVNLERIPAIHLACRPEYRLAELAAHVEQPEETLLLRPSGGEWLHVGGGAGEHTPEPFARCTVKNFGRLPLLDMHLPLTLSFKNAQSGSVMRTRFVLELPGLSADAAYEFSLLNGSVDGMRIAFDRTVFLSALDATGQVPEHLFADARVSQLEHMQIESGAHEHDMSAAGGSALVKISDFAYAPAVLHVVRGAVITFVNSDAEAHTVTSTDGAFDSGPIDPNQTWRHTFATPGKFRFRCAYHPYMRGEVDVR
jgi:plastocyanin